METTTRLKVHEENATRMFVYRVDESDEQTRRIHEYQRRSRSEEGVGASIKRERIIKKHHAAQRMLKPCRVVIPYAEEIEFPVKLRTRRDHNRFLDVIEASAFLHQKQRALEMVEGERVVYATGQDYAVAHEIVSHVLADTLSDVPPAALDLHRRLAAAIENGKVPDAFTKRQVHAACPGLSESAIYRQLRELLKHELVRERSAAVGRTSAKYVLEAELVEADFGIPSLATLTVRRMRAPDFWVA